MEFKVASFPAY